MSEPSRRMPERARPTRGQRAVRAFFAITAVVHGLLVLAQPFTAGLSLRGNGNALDWHGMTANTIVSVGLVLLIAAILAWRPGRRTVWAPVIALLLFAGETWQLAVGYGGELEVHLPLGVGIVIGSLSVIVMAFVPGWSLPARHQSETVDRAHS